MMIHHLVYGLIAHIVADWFLQNHWMAMNKTSLRHPAAWVHSGIHFLCLLFVFPLIYAAILGILHLAIDTRKPLGLWRRIMAQSQDGPAFIAFAMIQDQMLHVLTIFVIAVAASGG